MKILEMLQGWVNLKVADKYNQAVESDSMRKILYYEGMLHGVRELLAEFGIRMDIRTVRGGPFERGMVTCDIGFFKDD
ncbi:MAG: hypothetical protein J6V25_01915 [Oscillospiraceae bacterium]|nr:hypothetical protein [Oscillospiraceae bacterium]